jgi:hypothetical protein
MKKNLLFILCNFFWFIYTTLLAQQFNVFPNASTNASAGGTFLSPLANTARTYQMIIHASQLTPLVGRELTAIAFRLAPSASANWPATAATYTDYNIFLSNAVDPASRSLTSFASNVVGTQTQVRSGALNIAVGDYRSGGSPVNDFGTEITFNTPWLYTSGNLLIEIRQSGSTVSTSTEALGTTGTGYGTNFTACWASGITATAGSQGNFAVIRISSQAAAVPATLGNFSVTKKENDALLMWTTFTENNVSHFVIEKQNNTTENKFTPIGNVEAMGNSNQILQYNYIDRNATQQNGATVYYRLKKVDKDGSYSYSGIAKLLTPVLHPVIAITGNVISQNKLTLQIDAPEKEVLTYKVTNSMGMALSNGILAVNKGNNTLQQDLPNLSKGIYFMVISNGAHVQTLRFMKL